jgi:hypothetical protein
MSEMNGGHPDAARRGASDGDLSSAAVLALLRAHGAPAPYDSVDWTRLAQRIVATGHDELASRRHSAIDSPVIVRSGRRPDTSPETSPGGATATSEGAARRTAGRRWWEVTAGWARPTIAAAVVVSAVSAALAVGSPAASVVESGDAAGAAWIQSLAGRSSTGLVDRSAGIAIDPPVGTAARDSLFTEVVEQ